MEENTVIYMQVLKQKTKTRMIHIAFEMPVMIKHYSQCKGSDYS